MGGSPARVIQNRLNPQHLHHLHLLHSTTAEVSQATATSMDGYDSRKTKAKRKINDDYEHHLSGVEDQNSNIR
jgi:hypothetical protein